MCYLEKSRANLLKKIAHCSKLCDPEIVEASQKLDKQIVKTMFKKHNIRKGEKEVNNYYTKCGRVFNKAITASFKIEKQKT